MNEPRRIRGSLLERAAQYYDYGKPPAARPETGATAAQAPVPPVEVADPQPAPRPAAIAPARPDPVIETPAAPVVVARPQPLPMSAPIAVEPPAPVSVGTPEPVVEDDPKPASAPVAAPAPAVAPAQPARPVPAPAKTDRRTVTINRDRLEELGLLIPGAPVDVLAEEFRLVKRQLLLTARAVAGDDADRARMILVGSARPNEGKTFCAINLALSMAAEKDFEILLVDADFPKPDVLARLGVEEGPGLLDALADPSMDVEDCILATDVPGLSLLPAGAKSESDTELLASDRATAMLDGLAQANRRRIVIFDSPPVLAASPASVLALHVGQVMLVVRADRTTEGDLRDAVALLDGCEHIQLVLNSVSYSSGGYRFGTYYGQENSK